MINQRLDENCVDDLIQFSEDFADQGFPYRLTESVAARYCSGANPTDPTAQTYGIYFDGEKLVAVMTATFCFVFPHKDNPSGRIVHISGVYTCPEFRSLGCATRLLESVARDAKQYFDADYLCCDSTLPAFFKKHGFYDSNDERLWMEIKEK